VTVAVLLWVRGLVLVPVLGSVLLLLELAVVVSLLLAACGSVFVLLPDSGLLLLELPLPECEVL
jgi:hypothetical protein